MRNFLALKLIMGFLALIICAMIEFARRWGPVFLPLAGFLAVVGVQADSAYNHLGVAIALWVLSAASLCAGLALMAWDYRLSKAKEKEDQLTI